MTGLCRRKKETKEKGKKAKEKRKQELLEEIDSQVKKSSKLQLARTLAEQDDTLASLLKELDGLGD